MTIKLVDRVKELSYTVGTGNFSLEGAVAGFNSFSSSYHYNDYLFYAITDGTRYEVGSGQYFLNGSTNSLRRFPLRSSNNNQLVNFPVGTKEVYVTYPATHSVYGPSGISGFQAPISSGIAFWSGSNAINYDSSLVFDSTNKRIGLRKSNPQYGIDVGGNAQQGSIQASGFYVGSSGVFFPSGNNQNVNYAGGRQLVHFEPNQLGDANIQSIIQLSGSVNNHILLKKQNAGLIFAGPPSGCSPPCSPALPSFRKLIFDDIPDLTSTYATKDFVLANGAGGGAGNVVILNSGDNRLLTSTGSSFGINAESNLTFDGNIFICSGDAKIGNAHYLEFTNGVVSIKDESNRILFSSEETMLASLGIESINWNTRQLLNGPSVELDWSNGVTISSGLKVDNNIVWHSGNFNTSNIVRTNRNIVAGDGLSGGGNLSDDRTLSVNNTVVRTTGNQIVSGVKTFAENLLNLGYSNLGIFNGSLGEIGWAANELIIGNSPDNDLITDNRIFVGSAGAGVHKMYESGDGPVVSRLRFDILAGENIANTTLATTLTNGNITISLPNTSGTIALLSNINTTNLTGILPISKGGTGHTSISNGQLLIGSGTSFAANTLTAGTGISITSGSGTISINHTNESATLTSSVFNKTANTINKGSVVYIDGGQGDQPTIQLAIAINDAGSSKTYGIVQNNIPSMSAGTVVVAGAFKSFNTDQFNPTSPHGDVNGRILWLSPTTSGAMTLDKPSAPNHMVSVGTIVRTHQNQGVIEVKVQNGFELEELHDVAISGVTNGQFLQYNSGSGLWLASSSGNFSTLQVNGTGVSVSGHSHSASDIINFDSSVSGLIPTISNSGDNRILTSTGSSVGISAENNLTFDGNTLNIDGNLVFDSFTESVVAIGNSSTSQTLSLTNGTVQTCTLTGNCTFTMPAAVAGKSFTLFLNTGVGNFTGTFTGVLWAGNVTPTITTAANKIDILSFISNGTSWYGSYSQNYG